MHPQSEWANELRRGGVERASGPRALGGDDSADVERLGLHGAGEGENSSAGVFGISRLAAAEILGQLLLGTGVLCVDRGFGGGENT